MVVESPLFIVLFVVSVLWVASNSLTLELHGSFFLTPGFGIGRSMEPALPGGLTAYIEHYPISIEEGDIVSYEHPDHNASICHRVVEVDGDRIRIKGDNNMFDDGWFDKSIVIGKVWSPFGRTLYVPLSPTAMRGTIDKWRNT